MNILFVHPGKDPESLWASARAATEFGDLHIVFPERIQVSEPPRNLSGARLYRLPMGSLVEGVTVALNTLGLPKFDLAIIGCAVDDNPASRSGRREAASEAAYRGKLSALSVGMFRQPGERLAVKSIQYVVERLLRDVLLVKHEDQLVLDAFIPNLHPNLLSGFSLEAQSGSQYVVVSSLASSQPAVELVRKHVQGMGSRNAYEEANKVGDKSTYHFKGALLSDAERRQKLPPAGGGSKIQPYEVALLKRAKGRVLDVGCGDGRIAAYLTKQKHSLHISEVVGLDTTPFALQSYKARFAEEKLHPCINHFGDILADAWEHLGKFDTLLLCGNNFGIASDFNQVVEFLTKLKTMSHPGGRIIGSSRYPLCSLTPEPERGISRLNLERGFGAGERWLRLTYKKHDSGWFQWYYLSPQELERAARASGWRLDFILYEPENGKPIETLDFERFERESKSDEYGAILSVSE